MHVLAWALMIVIGGAHAGSADTDGGIGSLVARWDRPDSPGLTLAVLKQGRIVDEGAWGMASLELGVPLTPESRLNAASIAKQFTATALLLLEAQGKLSLDDDVGRHLPELPDYARPITLRQLLSHTSGLRDAWSLFDLAGWQPADVRTQQQALRLLARQRQLNFAPGRAFGYSNSGYLLAARVVETVTGRTFADWMRDRVLRPAGMRHSRFLDDQGAIVNGYASSYRWLGRDKGFAKSTLTSDAVGSGNLITTAGDLARWANYLLTSRMAGRALQAVLGESAVLTDGQKTGYGLGLFVGTRGVMRAVSHGGNSAGFSAHLLVVPEASLAVAVLANVDSVDARRLAEQLTDSHLGDRASPAPSRQPVPLPAATAGRYAGLYQLDTERLLHVRAVDGQLIFYLDGIPRPLLPLGEHRFGTDQEGVTLSFAVRADGSVGPLTLMVASKSLRGERVSALALTPEQLRSYEGRYYSEELETFYGIVAGAEQLVVRRLRGADFVLTPVAADWFAEQPAVDLTLRFHRNRFGRLRGFVLSVDRARGIWFQKQ